MILLIAFFCAAAYDITVGFKQGARNRWDATRSAASARRAKVKGNRSTRGHIRLRDLPERGMWRLFAEAGGAAKVIGGGIQSGWRRRHQALADWYDRRDREVPTRLQKKFDKRDIVPTPKPVDETKPEAAEQAKTDEKPADAKPTDGATPATGGAIPMPSGPASAPSNVTPIRPNLTNPTPTPAAAPATTGGTTMSDVSDYEMLAAKMQAVEDAARVNFEDKQADLVRARADLQNAQALADEITANWPNATATPFQQMIDDHQLAVNAATAAMAAAERRVANAKSARVQVNKQGGADEAARAAGWKGIGAQSAHK